jgi:signal transduction histidine kinase
LVGYLFLAVLVTGEWSGWIPAMYPEGAVSGQGAIDLRYVLTILVVYGLLFVLSAAILTSLMQLLRSSESKLLAVNVQLENLSAMRRNFLHIVLHDLKSPVAAISQHIFNLEATMDGALNEQQQQWIERCKSRLKDQMDFLHDLETLTLLESGDVFAGARPVSVQTMVDEVVGEYQDLARSRRQQLETNVAADVAPLMGIHRLVHEALANLVSNAIKYSPEDGRILVRAVNIGQHVRLEVHDTGPGIVAEDYPRLFQEFVRLRPKTTSNEPGASGSGLGLSIVKRIAESHGGRADVCSEKGKGSIFILEFPAAPRESSS